ncbi:MaoC family dehydratase [Novosphingobium mangrovi (ex Huang et al. 2023)]|uniref:MaoC family dehydratase n=1 Tax=Novosphingobium mangrovi (ex Huang et al. 2023) TaxID=2976432 RepID=A0ABT2I6M5_9SPHN|nr:MaoC family dehydratase [Novosphingobium mangrovi (ex Huang et al. 2023)]MCT2400460.1 MaoC family dehydratase [Novosphingobium mangrovi (ex Huang et al. 2023)]
MGEQGDETIAGWIASVVGCPAVSDWVTVDQAMISGFADVTRDWNFLHVDGDAARAVGMERTIAHGFLTLSLMSPMRMNAGLRPCPGLKMAMNYGLDGVRFLSPVHVGDRIRGRFTTLDIEETQPGRYRETVQASVEIEGQERPALVATWLAMYMT